VCQQQPGRIESHSGRCAPEARAGRISYLYFFNTLRGTSRKEERMENLKYLKRYVEKKPLKTNESYRNNLIERLDKFLKHLLKERETHRILSEEIVSDRQFHDGQSVMADKIAVRLQMEFLEELKK
ncbi:MAG: hypothetical protein ACUZ8I_10370, partial [Candidatus Scalindua sp.]